MRVEVPTFKKCCFCVPLRYGLLVWGYIKLVVSLSYLLMLALASIKATMHYHTDFLIVIAVAIGICLVDIAFTIVFVVGAHKKDYKLLRVFYYFTFTVLVIYIAVISLYTGAQIYIVVTDKDLPAGFVHAFILRLVEQSVFFFVNIVLQAYLLFLTRSEVIKLKGNCQFQFVNNAAESHCTMKEANGAFV